MNALKMIFASNGWQKLRAMHLPAKGGMILGVCAALGEATPFAAWMWRVAFCLTTLAWGFGLLLYVILHISIPEDGSE